MRIGAIAISCIILAGTALAECVASAPQESSRHVRIVVTLAGKPSKDVKVDFYPTVSQPSFSELTDDNGIVAPPELAAGDYKVIATLQDVVSTLLLLHVGRGEGVSRFSMDLTEPVQRAEALPIVNHIQAFEGAVLDPSGAMVSGTKILIVTKGSELQHVVLRTKVDANGHYSAQLGEGSYIAFFYAQGFRTAIVPLEITENGSGDLHVTLQIGRC